jgi:predicted Rossmann-fold nucleotide-binding protein
LGKYARDPITGSAADVVVVFSGGAGTLVELAFASFQNRPIMFQSSIQYLRMKCSFETAEVKNGLKKAKEGYPLISTNEGDLEDALARCLANPHCVDTPEEAARRVFGLVDGIVALQADTKFLGLPNDKGGHWKKKFNKDVAELSKLE